MNKRHPHKRAIPADERKRLRLAGLAWWINERVLRRENRYRAMKDRWRTWRLDKALRAQKRAKMKWQKLSRLTGVPGRRGWAWWKRLWAWIKVKIGGYGMKYRHDGTRGD